MIKLRQFLGMIFVLFLPLCPVLAQISQGGIPPSFQKNIRGQVPVKTMGAIDIDRLRQEDALREEDNLPLRFAEKFLVNYNLENSGVWTDLDDGGRLWRLSIECPGAITINLLYNRFELPEGAKLFIYNKDQTETIGAFTHQNNKKRQKFATGLVHGEQITLEYYLSPRAKETGALQISQVNHGYRLFTTAQDNNRGIGDSGACQVDVNCSPEGDNWQDEKKGIAGYTIGGVFYCSGSLVNNTNEDCKPYFLTADHCIAGSYDAITNPDGPTFVFLWNFERPNCSTGLPPDQTTAGCTIIANDGGSDFALFELTENPNDVYDVYFNGWDASGATGTGGVGIHHPSGDVKKIATHSSTPSNAGNYWELYWDPTANGHSVTEGGSSGSPLFNFNDHIIGQLYGGSSLNCSDPANDLGRYGKLSYSWDNGGTTVDGKRLSPWLDPVGGGTITSIAGGYSPCEFPEVRFLTKDATYDEGMSNITNGCIDYFEVDLILKVRTAPSQPVTVTMNAPTGNATLGENADYSFTPTVVTLDATNIAQKITVRIFNDAVIEPGESMTFSYTIDANGGDAVLGTVDQTNTITITDNDVGPANASISQVVYSEDFSAGFGAMTTSSSSNPAWEIGDFEAATSSYWGVVDNGTGDFAYTNDDRDTHACGNACDRREDYLISPTFDLVNACYISASLDFDYLFKGLTASGVVEVATAEISTDAGATWTELTSLAGNGSWQKGNVDLTPYLGQNNLKLAIHYNDGNVWHYGAAVDNFTINAVCKSTIQSAVSIGDEQYLGPNATVHFYDPLTNNIIATIENLDAHDYGCTTVSVERAGSGAAMAWSALPVDYIASKTYRVNPTTNNPVGNYNITLYYTEAEVIGWEAITGRAKSELYIVKTSSDLTSPQESDVRESYAVTEGVLGVDPTFTAQFSSGFSDFGIGPNTSVQLPIELLSFRGEQRSEGVQLKWVTNSEYDNDHFELEHSGNGRDFKQIANVKGAGTTTVIQNYDFLDKNFILGTNYYRLKQVDFDGRYEYSNIIEITVEVPDDYVGVLPNPTKGKVTIQLGSAQKGPAELHLYDVAGRLLQTKHVYLDSYGGLIDLDLSAYSAGIYLLQVIDRDRSRKAVRIVKE